jgi:hypothetical protein
MICQISNFVCMAGFGRISFHVLALTRHPVREFICPNLEMHTTRLLRDSDKLNIITYICKVLSISLKYLKEIGLYIY